MIDKIDKIFVHGFALHCIKLVMLFTETRWAARTIFTRAAGFVAPAKFFLMVSRSA